MCRGYLGIAVRAVFYRRRRGVRWKAYSAGVVFTFFSRSFVAVVAVAIVALIYGGFMVTSQFI